MSRLIEMEYFLKAPVERVWAAVTTPELMTKWMGNSVTVFEHHVGGRIEIEHIAPGTVVQFDPPHRFTWTGDPAGGSDSTNETIALYPEGEGTRLVLKVVATGMWADDPFMRGAMTNGWRGWLEALTRWVQEGIENGERPHGMLNASLGAEEQGAAERVFFRKVNEGGVCAAAGILPGDTLLTWNGQRVDQAVTFWRLFQATVPGQRVRLELERNGKLVATEVVMAEDQSA